MSIFATYLNNGGDDPELLIKAALRPLGAPTEQVKGLFKHVDKRAKKKK